MAASVKSSTFTGSKFRCIQIYWTFSRVELKFITLFLAETIFAVVITSMVSRKNYFNVKCPHFTIYHNLTYHPILNSFENNVFLLNPSLQIMNIYREY